MDIETIQALSSIVQASTSIFLLGVTWRYVVLTSSISKSSSESVKQLIVQNRPMLLLSVRQIAVGKVPQAVEIEGRNLGVGPAVNVAVEYTAVELQMDIVDGEFHNFAMGAEEHSEPLRIRMEAPVKSAGGPLRNLGRLSLSYTDIHGKPYASSFDVSVDKNGTICVKLTPLVN